MHVIVHVHDTHIQYSAGTCTMYVHVRYMYMYMHTVCLYMYMYLYCGCSVLCVVMEMAVVWREVSTVTLDQLSS